MKLRFTTKEYMILIMLAGLMTGFFLGALAGEHKGKRAIARNACIRAHSNYIGIINSTQIVCEANAGVYNLPQDLTNMVVIDYGKYREPVNITI